MLTTETNSTAAVLQHLPLVQRVAKRIARRLPRGVALDELVSAGTLGLMDALTRFDRSRVGSFGAYAEIRIRGAILDHLRSVDWLPRATRAQVRRGEVDAGVMSVEDVREDGFESFDSQIPSPTMSLERRERRLRLTSAIARLPARDRQVLALYYVSDMTLKQIGEVFGVSESRVSQLHSEAVGRLRLELADDVELN